MSVELYGVVPERFEFATLGTAFELIGDGRLARLALEFGAGWLTPRSIPDAVGIDIEHEAGPLARVRVRPGQRVRVEVSIESATHDVVTVPGPVMWVSGQREPVSWHAEASAEIVLPSPLGPGILTQRRGLSSPGEEPGMSFPLGEEVALRPRQVLSSAWTYEAFEGTLLDVPTEPSWLPWVRYVPLGESVAISAPDGLVTVEAPARVEESEGDFEVYPPEGLCTASVWGAGGRSLVELGAYRELSELRHRVASVPGSDDVWCYLAVRQLLEDEHRYDLVDRVDWVLGTLEEHPSAWSACACLLAVNLGLPLEEQAHRAAAAVLALGRRDDALLLALHGLAPAEVIAGGWPVGDFDALGVEAVAALSYGRVHTDGRRERGRDVAVAKLFAAGLGESERGLHAASCAQAAEARLLCLLTVRPSPVDLAWLSVP